MEPYLTPATVRAAWYAQVKATVLAHECNVTTAAVALNMSMKALSRLLNQKALGEWWRKEKARKRRRTAAARQARWRARRAQRIQSEMAGY